MGQKDAVEKTLESYNDVFADIVNGLLFHGKEVVREQDLTDAQSFSIYKADGKHLGQDRDVAKFWQEGQIRLSFIGMENQTKPDSRMPVRVINYDAAAYRAQLRDDGPDELYPVLTLVLYFGTEERWGKRRKLKDCLKNMPPELEPYISDYGINVFELAWLDDETTASFKSDFCDVVEFLRCERTRSRYTGTDRQLRHVQEVLDLMKLLTADNSFDDIGAEIIERNLKTGGMTNMSYVIQMIREEGEKQGFANGEKLGFVNGEKQGFADGRDTVYTLLADLQAAGKTDELTRVLSDRNYMEQLLAARRG